ncbi:MAG TPA: ABC transporter substrate-binding protein [Acidimicrobiales bacterium]|nr:ABC transporter substrate-binding protein [Acidimicrobiales bacterium]
MTVAALLVAATFLASCSSSPKTSTTTSGGAQSTTLGRGVTASTIKVGVSLVDFNCISQFVNQIRVNQDQVYQAFFNYVNSHGGVAGRKLVPDFQSFCPIGNAQALALCTKFAEDDGVFAVLGNFVDFTGDAQTCLAKDHDTVLLTFQLTQAIMSQSPPGLIILPGETPERTDGILVSLLKKQGTLKGKKIAILSEVDNQSVVTNAVQPALGKLGIPTGSTAILDVTGADTSAAQAQLDSFIERWKSENVSALFVTGTQVSSQQFIEKVRAQMPNVALVTDTDSTVVQGYGQQEKQAGRVPNPYEGILTAAGPTSQEYDQSANWRYCSGIYQQETGKVAPNAEAVVPGPNGKTLDTYGSINDACQLVTMFHDIASRVGTYLNTDNWVRTVDSFGNIRNVGDGQYASLHTGKYDVADTFRLEEFDSSIGAKGQYRPLTPLEDITGS